MKRCLNFSDRDRKNHRNKQTYGSLKDYVKYVVGSLRRDKKMSARIIERFAWDVKRFSSFLQTIGYDSLSYINEQTMIDFENSFLKKTDLSLSAKGSTFRSVVTLLDHCNVFVKWQSPKISNNGRGDADHYYANRKAKRPPREVLSHIEAIAGELSMSAKAKLADGTWTVEDSYDLFTASVFILEFGSYSRINEVLFLSTDCEYYGGDPSWKAVDPQTVLPEYALVMFKEKPKIATMKPAVPEYSAVLHQVIEAINAVTELSRRYAKYWEDRGETTYVLDNKTQTASESLFCFIGDRLDSKLRLTEKVLDLLEKGGEMTVSRFCLEVAGRYTRGFPRLMKKLGNRKKGTCPKYDVADLCSAAFGTGQLFSYHRLVSYLKRQFIEKYHITHNDKPYKLNPHQIRHFTTTEMLNRGIDMERTDTLHGRSSKGQSAVYDHPTTGELYKRHGGVVAGNDSLVSKKAAELDKCDFIKKPLEINCDMREDILALARKNLLMGPTARAYGKLCQRRDAQEITEEECKRMEWQYFPMISISPLRLGLCSHSWYEHPCSYHYSCLFDDDGKVCNKLLPFKHPRTLEICSQIYRDLEFELDMCRKREPSEYGNLWITGLEQKRSNVKCIEYEIREFLEAQEKKRIDDRVQLEKKDETENR